MSIEEKKLTVLFPLYKEDSEVFVLLGKNAEGTKMPGIRNGFGGKCEIKNWITENILECVIRETKEETDNSIDLRNKENSIKKIWNVIMWEMIITFFAVYLEDKIIIRDNSEMVDIRWFNIKNTNDFLFEMLSGDEKIIKELEEFIYNEETYSEFNITKTGDKVLQEQVKNVYK